MGSQVERTRGKAAAGGLDEAAACRLGSPTFSADKLGGTAEEQSRPRNLELQNREIKPQTSD